MTHTPKPWEASADAVPDWYTQITVYGPDGRRIATVFNEDDAKLIRMAPELREELEFAVGWMTENAKGVSNYTITRMQRVLDEAS